MSIEVTVVAELVSPTKWTGSETVELFAGEQIVTVGCVWLTAHCPMAKADVQIIIRAAEK